MFPSASPSKPPAQEPYEPPASPAQDTHAPPPLTHHDNPEPRTQQPTRASLFRATHAAARHGNYHSYYTSFRSPTTPDPRLALLLPLQLLPSARVLDLGCNAGKLTHECVAHCGAREAVGVDIDGELVARARELYGEEGRVVFEQFDFVDRVAWEGRAAAPGVEGGFDVVLLLSVTKWIHLNSGDEGLRRVFGLAAGILKHGGVLVVEPQPWDNYKRAVKRCPMLRGTFKGLKMRPPFWDELRREEFEFVREIERDEEGFARPLHIWRKV